MTPLQSITICLRKYANYEGRASRSEYWWFFAFMIGLYALALVIDRTRTLPSLVALALVIPWLTVSARRLHDLGYSGWFALVCLIPPPSFWLAWFFVQKGVEGPNQYGPEPL